MVPRADVELRVVPRNLRWEVATNGVTRRLVDWTFSKERALAHALARAEELAAGGVDVPIVLVVLRADFTEESREVLHVPGGRSVRVA